MYLARSERDTPLVFKGRREIIDRMSTQVDLLKNLDEHSDESFTQVIYGPPGAGKTALLGKLKEKFEHERIIAIEMQGADLHRQNQFLIEALTELGTNWDKLSTRKSRKSKFGFKLFGRAGFIQRPEQPSILKTLESQSVWEILQTAIQKQGKVIALFIDEAQNIVKEANAPIAINELLEDLHTCQTGELKIMPIFAGLNDTQDALANSGISRINLESIYQIGKLSYLETEQVGLEVLNHSSLGMQGCFNLHHLEKISKSLAIASDQWPRHLHYYLRGVLLEIHNDQLLSKPTKQLNLEKALEYGHESRLDYYQERISRLRPHDSMIRGLITTVKDGESVFSKDDLRAAVRNFGAHGTEFNVGYDRAFHFGLIEPVGIGMKQTFRIPIPSLETFLRCECDRKMTLTKLHEEFKNEMSKNDSNEQIG